VKQPAFYTRAPNNYRPSIEATNNYYLAPKTRPSQKPVYSNPGSSTAAEYTAPSQPEYQPPPKPEYTTSTKPKYNPPLITEYTTSTKPKYNPPPIPGYNPPVNPKYSWGYSNQTVLKYSFN
jgi:hypothetical protein